MTSILISSIAGFVSFILLDYVWLTLVAKDFYLKSLASHVLLKDSSLVPYLPAIPLVYIVAVTGIFIFVTSRVSSTFEAFLFGAVLGFVMYAFYDFTNLATLKDYPWSLTIVDMLWGTVLVATVSAIIFFVKSLLA